MKNGPLTWTSKLQTLPYWDIPLLFTNCIIQSWEVHHHADNSWWESCIRMPFWWWIWATSWASLVAHMVKNPPEIWETWVWSLGWEEPLEEAMAPTPVFSPRESPCTEKPGRLQSIGPQREGNDWSKLAHAQILWYHPIGCYPFQRVDKGSLLYRICHFFHCCHILQLNVTKNWESFFPHFFWNYFKLLE